MSHRVTTETEMRDKDLVLAACKDKNIACTVQGNTIRFETAPLNGAELDLRTGRMIGDTDRQSAETLGMLAQAYGKAKAYMECAKQGIQVEREYVRNGNIVLVCAMG
mgnify:CR=1 FL=1